MKLQWNERVWITNNHIYIYLSSFYFRALLIFAQIIFAHPKNYTFRALLIFAQPIIFKYFCQIKWLFFWSNWVKHMYLNSLNFRSTSNFAHLFFAHSIFAHPDFAHIYFSRTPSRVNWKLRLHTWFNDIFHKHNVTGKDRFVCGIGTHRPRQQMRM